ncbi:MAG TPA: hypothetical protein VJT73_05385, partial [Polyangiaceae bacterium]|nr:hypothetical protein [Polyangiaceae bacterium]
MARARIWLLNFDADDELAGPRGYTPRAALLERSGALRAKLTGLVPPGDEIIDERVVTRAPEHEGRAFCPTPRAIRAWLDRGAVVPLAPSLETLRRVNHRAFSARLGHSLPGARFVETAGELASVLAGGAGPWLLKRAFGFAGRGRQRLRSNEVDAGVEPFVRASFTAGHGLLAEPWVDLVAEFGLHGFIS